MAARGVGNLSPRLAELAAPSLQGASPAKQARALDLAPEGPGSLLREGERVLARVRFDHGALSALEDLRSAGAETVDSSGVYQTVTVAAKPEQLLAIASVPGVEGVTPILSPLTAAPVCPSGAIVSEGDEQLNAKTAREGPPALDGSGVTVGILSDSFNQATEAPDDSGKPIATHANEDVASGDLPGACPGTTTTQVLSKKESSAGATDEGRAMAQIVHDLAPRAKIKFASAFNGEESFAHNIEALVEAGAGVIVDDVFYQEEPFFQDGQVAVAVKKAVEAGTTYFSAAGNNNLIDEEGHDIASWETPEFRDAQSCPPEVQAIPAENGSHCLNFNPGTDADKTFGMRVEPGATLTVDLQWDEPWNGVATDLDAFLLDSDGDLIAQSRERNIQVSQMPFESFAWTNISATPKTVQLAVNRFAGGGSPTVKFALIENGGGVEATEYPRSTGEDVVGPTIFGHSGSAAAISTGAVAFNDASEPESYSSRGPVRHDFGPLEEKVAAEPLEPPEEVSKPDLTATDCGKTTFFAFLSSGFWHFCGTSAAAPHAAAVAALMLQAEPAAEPEDIREALLHSAAMPFEPEFGPCAVGAGLVEAVGAIESLLAPTAFTPPLCSPPVAEGSPEEARAPGDWGSESHPPSFTPPVVVDPTPGPKPEVIGESRQPRTFILLRPPRTIRTRGRSARVAMRFGSDEADVTYVCQIDGAAFRRCPERLARRFEVGSHVVLAVARDAAGNDDHTPVAVRFKVKHVG
jgi:Subtilase family